MSPTARQPVFRDQRELPRDDVHYRARGVDGDARSVPLLIVNVSVQGFMARCDHAFAPGDRLQVKLPVAGEVTGEVRWALGGRVGCELITPIPLALYFRMLAEMLGRA